MGPMSSVCSQLLSVGLEVWAHAVSDKALDRVDCISGVQSSGVQLILVRVSRLLYKATFFFWRAGSVLHYGPSIAKL